VNVPVFGDTFNFPLFRRLDLEASWRHDQYHGTLRGGTSNPKIGFNWGLSEDAGVSIRGSWGTSFRFANAGEYSTIASSNFQDFGLSSSAFGTINIQCAGGAPPQGSTAEAVFLSGAGSCSGPSSVPIGISFGGAPHKETRL
jgi:outer membrane receptor protein involved in Fe transport